MKTSLLSAAALFGVQALAFPPWLMNRDLDDSEIRRLSNLAARLEIEKSVARRDGLLGFDAEKQFVSTSGEHEFVAPGPNDLRGPCPGLNAMANHGYLPHDGVGTITDFIEGTYDVFGMGLDLSAFLGVYGAVFDGDLTSWSIGGEPPGGLLSGIGLLGKPQGLSGSHNKYESDASPTRPDLYAEGNNYKLQISQFEEFYNMPLGDNGYDLSVITPFRAKRFEQSIQTNPDFFNGPFTGVVVQPAAYTFIYRFMGNKSEEYPDGYLDADVLKTFFSVSGEPGSFEWNAGHERIPENWYKRAIGDEYTIPRFQLDFLAAALEFPQFLSVGGNTDGVDTFTGVDLTDLTGGVYNLESLAEGNNAICFAFQAAGQMAPDILGGLFSQIRKPLSQINDAIGDVLGGLSCPQLNDLDASFFDIFPGAKTAE